MYESSERYRWRQVWLDITKDLESQFTIPLCNSFDKHIGMQQRKHSPRHLVKRPPFGLLTSTDVLGKRFSQQRHLPFTRKTASRLLAEGPGLARFDHVSSCLVFAIVERSVCVV
jgi:hypothetical protein